VPTADRTLMTGSLAQVGRGFVMGSADIVPGVSGGTVALVFGIYERLIHNIRTGAHALKQLVTGDIAGVRITLREIEWVWLISLLAGILIAIAALSSAIERLLDEQPIAMAGLFFGLVVGAIWVAWNQIGRIDAGIVAIVVAVGLGLFLLLGLRSDTEVADDAAEVVTEPLWAFFLAGAIAICAMILPGISGSFILVMLGMYTEVLGAVNDRDVASLGIFALGCVVGLALFSTLLNWLLENYHDRVMAAMVGLMIGSTRVLWPWPNGTHTTTLSSPGDDVVLTIVLALAGTIAVVLVERVGRGRQPATNEASRETPSTRSSSPSAKLNRP
jgi:putative membrane protein